MNSSFVLLARATRLLTMVGDSILRLTRVSKVIKRGTKQKKSAVTCTENWFITLYDFTGISVIQYTMLFTLPLGVNTMEFFL